MHELKLDIYAPVTRTGFGPLTIDPIEMALGMPLPKKMEPILREPHHELAHRDSKYYKFPCAIQEGVELALSLGPLGDMAMSNEGGQLKLVLPKMMADAVISRLGPELITAQQDVNPGVILWLDLNEGFQLSVPLGNFGALDFVVGG